MQVVNCKVAYIRPKYKNLKEWCEDPKNAYIGRRGIVFVEGKRYPPNDSIFCNPFKVGRDGNRDEVLTKYFTHLKKNLEDPEFVLELKKLKGKNLGCWCKPESCHGDILLEIIQNLKS